MDLRGENQTGQRHGIQVLVGRTGRRGVHGCTGLGEEVLDDDLLDVAVSSVRCSDGLQGGDPIAPVLADPDQNPGGEWDGELSRRFQSGQPAGR